MEVKNILRQVIVLTKSLKLGSGKARKKAFDDPKALVVMEGIEPPTQGFSVLCSTN
jgi:hypothetical protein